MSENQGIEVEGQANRVVQGYSKIKFVICYVLAAGLGVFVMYAIGGPVSAGINHLMGLTGEAAWDWMTFFQWVGFVTCVILLSIHFGNMWRSKVDEIKTPFGEFANFFYDPHFEPGSLTLQIKYQQLLAAYGVTQDYLEKAKENAKATHANLLEIQESLQVFVRHHDNANRLLGSAAYLLKEGKHVQFVDTMLQSILNECTTILQRDYNDKSIALYQVDGEQLIMRSYNRIGAESAATRKFKKGEGFAGFVWETNHEFILDNIDLENDSRFQGGLKPKHAFKSILGVPISIGDDVLGVLCLQCERENGFTQEDLRAVMFYAKCCSLILLYDKLKEEEGGD